MIFYFSGTGNSFHAAQQVLREGEQLLSIGECVKNKKFIFELQWGESLGIVCPTYFGGIPSIVHYFLSKLELRGPEPIYTYGLLTCGGAAGGAPEMLRDRITFSQDLFVDAVYTVEMPDNYVILYKLDEEADQNRTLMEADLELEEIAEKVAAHEVIDLEIGKKARMMTKALYPMYVRGRKTEKFWVDDRCVGCGMCAKRCPSGAIELVDGTPTWTKDQCVHCLGCINRCSAIQYGKKTIDRDRYVHPVWRKKH